MLTIPIIYDRLQPTDLSCVTVEGRYSGSRIDKPRPESVLHFGASKTIQEMIAEETSSKYAGSNMDNAFAQNIYRLGRHYKASGLMSNGPGKSSGADEEDIDGDGGVHANMFSYDRKKSNRQGTILEQDDVHIQKCWWWLQSSSFRRHMLISLGNHVSLPFS